MFLFNVRLFGSTQNLLMYAVTGEEALSYLNYYRNRYPMLKFEIVPASYHDDKDLDVFDTQHDPFYFDLQFAIAVQENDIVTEVKVPSNLGKILSITKSMREAHQNLVFNIVCDVTERNFDEPGRYP